MVYRTGPYAPSGIPVADGFSDYVNLINERDGGLNGVKLRVEECETQYNTERGVECYERLKAQGGTIFSPYSTGITYALIDRAAADKSVIRSEEHTSELQSLMRISYAVFCLKKKKTQNTNKHIITQRD